MSLSEHSESISYMRKDVLLFVQVYQGTTCPFRDRHAFFSELICYQQSCFWRALRFSRHTFSSACSQLAPAVNAVAFRLLFPWFH